MQTAITKEEINAVYPTVAETIADALGCEVAEVKPDASLIEDLGAESIDFLDMFGGNPPPVTAFKWSFGHLIAAAGIVEATLALVALRRGSVPGIAVWTTPDPDCAGVPVSASAQAPTSDIALVICRGFASTNAALVVRAL